MFETDLKIKPLNVWRFYNLRAAVELIIKGLKANYPLAKIPPHDFAANENEAYFHLLLFACNLVNWFKPFCLPPSAQSWTLKNLRAQMLFVPGELVRTHNKPPLKFPANYWSRDNIASAMKQLKTLKI
ncbi:MAG: transposase [Candidatus Aminicenantales bacterium]